MRRASKRRPRAAEVMARSRHVLRVLEVRCFKTLCVCLSIRRDEGHAFPFFAPQDSLHSTRSPSFDFLVIFDVLHQGTESRK